jgi:hypothetical protein
LLKINLDISRQGTIQTASELVVHPAGIITISHFTLPHFRQHRSNTLVLFSASVTNLCWPLGTEFLPVNHYPGLLAAVLGYSWRHSCSSHEQLLPKAMIKLAVFFSLFTPAQLRSLAVSQPTGVTTLAYLKPSSIPERGESLNHHCKITILHMFFPGASPPPPTRLHHEYPKLKRGGNSHTRTPSKRRRECVENLY